MSPFTRLASRLLLLACALLTPPLASAAPVSLIGERGVEILRPNLKANPGSTRPPADFGSAELLAPADPAAGGPVWRTTATSLSNERWNVRLDYANTAPVAAGDRLLLSFSARVVTPAQAHANGYLSFGLKLPGSLVPNVAAHLAPGPEWETYHFPFIATADAAPGAIYGNFDFGGLAQVMELKDLALLNHGPDHDLATLPRTRFTYPERPADAPWRAEAAARIARHRERDLALVLPADFGAPGATATVRLVRHDFRFGTAIAHNRGERYDAEVLRLFHAVTPENTLKSSRGQFFSGPGSRGRDRALAQVEWARRHDLKLHGHLLFWPMWRYMGFTPDEEKRYRADAPALRARILSDAEAKLRLAPGAFASWEVMNEATWQREVLDFLNAAGISDADIVEDLVRLARRLDPAAALMLNDAGIDTTASVRERRAAYYEALFAELRRRGAPLDGFGFQGHFGTTPPTLDSQWRLWDRFAALGLRIYITEFDITTEDTALQADWTRDFLTLAFSHPAVDMFTFWGFWEGAHWKPGAALYRRDWTPKPNALAYEALLAGWTTRHENLALPADRTLRFRGSPGIYEVTIGDETRRLTPEIL